MNKQVIISNVVTAVITALIIAAATGIFNWASEGGLVGALGGVVKEDLNDVRDEIKKLAELAEIRYGYRNIKFCRNACGGGSDIWRVVPIDPYGNASFSWVPEAPAGRASYGVVCAWSTELDKTFSRELMSIKPTLRQNKIEVKLKIEEEGDGFVTLRISYLMAME